MLEAVSLDCLSISDKSGERAPNVVGFNAERLKRATIDSLISELASVALGVNIGNFLGDDGQFLHPLEWTPEEAAVVERISIHRGRVVGVALKDKSKALAMLLRLTTSFDTGLARG